MVQPIQGPQGAVLVLGMHRSGTSALTRGLEVLGIDLGRNLKDAVAGDNDKGFFEEATLSEINDRVLALNGGVWDSLFADAIGVGAGGELGKLKLEALQQLQRTFGQSAFFGFKDPRTCRTLPFWQDVLARHGARVFNVIAFRNPMSVAESLHARNGFERERSYHLWLVHMLAAVKHTQGQPRVFIEYDDLIADPEPTLTRISELIDDPRVAIGAHAMQIYQRDFLDRALRRHFNQTTHLDLDEACSPLVRDLYQALRRQAKRPIRESGDDEWAPLLEAFDKLAPHLDFLDLLDRQRLEAGHNLALSRQEVEHLRQVISERDGHILAAAAARDSDVAALRAELADATSAISGQAAAFAAELLSRDEQLAAAAASEAGLRESIGGLTAQYQADVENLAEQVRTLQEAVAAAEARYDADVSSLTERLQSLAADSAEALAQAQRTAERQRAVALDAAQAKAAEDAAQAEAAAQHRLDAILASAERSAAAAMAELERRHQSALRGVERAAHAVARREIELAEQRAFALLAAERADAEKALHETQRQFLDELDSERQHILETLEAVRRAADEDVARANRASDEQRAELMAQMAAYENAAAAAAHDASAVRHAYGAIAERLRAVYESSSWRFTAPLRGLKAMISNVEINETVPAAPEVAHVAAAPAPASIERVAPVAGSARRRVHFTICAKNYLPIARTCLQTSQIHHPDAEHYLVLCDEIDQGYDPAREGFSVINVHDLAIACFADMSLRYDVMELSTAIKPFCFTHFFNSGAEEVVYLDPDLLFVGPMVEMADALNAGAEAVLTPHITLPIEDDRRPNDNDMLRAGVYNLGFLALRRSQETQAFVTWWGERLRTMAVSDIERGLFTDQKWCDLLPCLVERTYVLRHPGYNLAYWNLMHRPVAQLGDAWTAAHQPIRFVHFSGASFTDENIFSKHQNRFDANSIGALRALYDSYRDMVRANGMGTEGPYRYSFDYDPRGARIGPILRVLYREEFAPEGPHAAPDIHRLYSMANESAPGVPSFDGVRVTRLMHRIWKSRPDLQAAFALDSANGQLDFVNWCRHSFAREYLLEGDFYPLQTSGDPEVRVADGDSRAAAPLSSLSRTLLSRASALRPIYRHLPVSVRHRAKVILTRSAYATSNKASEVSAAPDQPGVTLVGYARGELGMGEHVRMTASALQRNGVPIGIVNISDNVLARQEDRRFDHLHTSGASFRANIFHVNADQLPVVCASLGDNFLSGRRNIAYPAWELGEFPKEWTPQLNAMDEVWAPSRFIQEALTRSIQRPVVHMPLAVEIAEGYDRWRREDFGIPDDAFVFLFYFDLASFASRKNPIGVLEAYRRAVQALGATTRPPMLVVKVISADRFPDEFAQLRSLVASVAGVMLIPEVFSSDRIHGLVNCSDAFVSLHRSEGFGRGPAEAMRLGKAAIATGFSGNMDYMSGANSFPVGYTLRAVQPNEYPYGQGQSWADPDIGEAAAIMCRLVQDPSLAREIGARARLHMETYHSSSAIGRRYAARLKAIGALN